MKKLRFMAIFLAATTLFASCSKSDNPGPSDDDRDKKVSISFVNGVKNDVSRSSGMEIPDDGYAMKFTDGMLYFTDDAGDIVYNVVIAKNAVGSGIHPDDLNGETHRFTIPTEASRVYVIGNLKDSYPNAGNISQLTEQVMDMDSQTDLENDKGISLVTLYGANVLSLSSGKTDEYEAEVEVRPIGARVEIDKFTATNVNGTITSYEIEGIFLYNLYRQSLLTGKKSGNLFDLKDGTLDPTDPASFAPGADPLGYLVDDNGLYYDYKALSDTPDESGIGTSNGQVYTPKGTNNVWAYNLFAPTDATAAFPTIVVKLNNIDSEYINPAAGAHWLTIKSLKYAAGETDESGTNIAGQYITSIEAGKIYKIENVEFNGNNIETAPNLTTVTADVSVKMIDWKKVVLEPEF